MKKIILLLPIVFGTALYAQTPEDALRFSFYPQNGSARNMAIGGAMGSLGGDINATFVNPAGLGFYKTNEFVLTPNFNLNNNKADFRETANQNKRNSIGFGTSGWVWGFGDRYKPKNSYAVSLAVNQTANFNNQVQYKGLNNYSSFSEQFAEEFAKSGRTIDDVLNSNSPYPYTSAPALYTYLIDTVTVMVNGQPVVQVKGAPEYILDAHQAIRQEMARTTTGGISEIALGLAHNYADKWFFGGTIGIPIVTYHSVTTFSEFDTSANTNNHFNQFKYTDDFKTTGAGANLKLGVIYRPKEYIRLGLAVHTPTYMFLKDTRTTSLNTFLENPVNNFSVTSQTFTNQQPGVSKYTQTTPFKAMLSASYVFREVANVKRQKAFITADVEYVHYKGSRFGSANENPTDAEKAYYKQLGNVIKEDYKGNFNFRVGGELKCNIFMGRLGFAYYGNPYKDAPAKVNKMLLSGGLGYRNKGMFIDLTYVHNISKDIDMPYRLEDRANTFATLKQQRGTIVGTLGIKF
ncbi:MAG: hypothetical protein JST86_13565 [Bacteroidetes bacterium]|nr:hypothetical protein [Bacteroidota bacterium]